VCDSAALLYCTDSGESLTFLVGKGFQNQTNKQTRMLQGHGQCVYCFVLLTRGWVTKLKVTMSNDCDYFS